MDLAKLIKDNREELTVWVPFGDFDIEIIYTNRRELERMLNKSRKHGYDSKTHQPTEELNDELFVKQLAGKVKGWRGLTWGKVIALSDIKAGDIDPKWEVPCTEESKIALIDELYGLVGFIRQVMVDIEQFREKKIQAESKNSDASQDG